MLTQQQIDEIRAKSGLQPSTPPQKGNYTGKYDYLKKDSTFTEEAGKRLKERGEDVAQTFKDTAEGNIHPLSGSLQTVGAGAGAVSDVIFEGIKSITPKPVRDFLASAIQKIAGNKKVSSTLQKIDSWSQRHPEASKDLGAVVDIASIAPVAKGGQLGIKATSEAAKVASVEAKKGLAKSGDLAIELAKKGKKVLEPKQKTGIEATGQILQGKPKDIKEGVRALSAIDIKGIDTFGDLKSRLRDKISKLSRQVDNDLGTDATKRKLKDLGSVITGESGNISVNPVETALKQLDELYSKTGDSKKLIKIRDTISKAQNEGLTNLEINNLARKYGSEFGSKAFGKNGDPLTSVNAKLFENTRTDIKEVARSGIKGKEAQIADQTTSSLINTEKLIQKNLEAVNKLQQKIQQRGLLEKIGHNLTKYADVLTGGSIRGLVGGLLPRGVGNKTLNALDIEEVLAKNLQLIKEAINSGNEKEIIDILKKIQQ